jgi:hypothetical protein
MGTSHEPYELLTTLVLVSLKEGKDGSPSKTDGIKAL